MKHARGSSIIVPIIGSRSCAPSSSTTGSTRARRIQLLLVGDQREHHLDHRASPGVGTARAAAMIASTWMS